MIFLIWLQFKHSFKIWMSSLIVFFAVGFLTSVCLIGLFSLLKASTLGQEGLNQTIPVFIMPAVFGGITVLFVISGIIRLIINHFKEEYILWTVLGSNPNQLALLVGGQLAMIGAIGGFLGYLCALPFTPYTYYWMQGIVGERMLPTLSIGFSFSSFIVTLLFLFLLGGLGGFLHSRKLFLSAQKDIIAFKKQSNKRLSWFRIIMIGIYLLAIIGCYVAIFATFPPIDDRTVSIDMIKTELCFGLIFLLIFFILSTAKIILPKVITVLTTIAQKNKSVAVNTAYWQVVTKKDYLGSVIVPILVASLLLSGFSSVITNILSQTRTMGAEDQSLENLIIFILYLAPPLIVILANVIVISIVSSNQQASNTKQLILLGFTTGKMIQEKFCEVCIYAFTFLCSSLVLNFFVTLAVAKVTTTINQNAIVSYEAVYYWPLVLTIAIMIVMSAINFVLVIQNNRVMETNR